MRILSFFKKSTALLVVIFLCTPFICYAQSSYALPNEFKAMQLIIDSDNPLINPEYNALFAEQKIISQPDIINILLLGIDNRGLEYALSNEIAQTDTIIVLSINLNENNTGKAINTIAISRDTIVYVPGVKGIYKINGAVNCGDAMAVGASRADDINVVPQSTVGFDTICSTVSWLLGGIKIDYYCAVTMNALVELGNVIGGVDYDLEIDYTGTDKNRNSKDYYKGPQHLDGAGILSYISAGKNGTIGNDNTQTGTLNQANMMQTIINKFITDKSLILKTVSSLRTNNIVNKGFYTNLSFSAMMKLAGVGMDLLSESNQTTSVSDLIGSYSLLGDYTDAFAIWRFRFINQENRSKVIKESFGVDVEKLKYASYDYLAWLYVTGFKAIRFLAVADEIRNSIAINYKYDSILVDSKTINQRITNFDLSNEQILALKSFNAAYYNTIQAFLAASSSVNASALGEGNYDQTLTIILENTYIELINSGNQLAKLVGYPSWAGNNAEEIVWSSTEYMDEDPLINEIYVNYR